VYAAAFWTVVFWASVHAGLPGGVLPWAAGGAGLIALAVARARRTAVRVARPVESLVWSGVEWQLFRSLPVDGTSSLPARIVPLLTPDIVLDVGGCLILRMRTCAATSFASEGTQWAAVHHGAAPGSWRGLRAALNAARREDDSQPVMGAAS